MYPSCAIICGGEPASLTDLNPRTPLIVCDKGYEYAVAAGLTPTLFVGDGDSNALPLPPELPRLQLPVEKDDTDTLAALRYALQAGYRDITLYCAFGGRLDHLLGNLQAGLFAVDQGARLRLVGANDEVWLFSHASLQLPPRAGRSLSLLSLTDHCDGVSATGVKYPLNRATLTNRFPLGVSNEWVDTATVSVENGVLAVIVSRL